LKLIKSPEEVSLNNLASVIFDLICDVQSDLPEDVEKALVRAYEAEDSDVAKLQLKMLLENVKLARELKRPICQDTGLLTFFISAEKKHFIKDVEEAICQAVRKATSLGLLRPNVVNPLTRISYGDNCAHSNPIIYWEVGEELKISLLVKGAGSENVSLAKVLDPEVGVEGVKEVVVKAVVEAGGKPCPPIFLGIGIGGTIDLATKLAKKALLRKVGERSRDPFVAKLEVELLEAINSLGIGTMGLGGKVTALDVFIETAGCHTASFPIAIVFQCWAHRRGSVRLM